MQHDGHARWVMDALVRHEASLLRYAASLVGSSLAADVVQDTFLRLCSAKQAEVEGHLAAWLYTVCKHRAIELGRKERRLQSLEESNVDESPDSGPVNKLERKESLTRVGEALAGLPEREREAVLLKLDAGLSYKEIAEVMGLSVSNVGFILHTAIKSIREEIQRAPALAANASGRTS